MIFLIHGFTFSTFQTILFKELETISRELVSRVTTCERAWGGWNIHGQISRACALETWQLQHQVSELKFQCLFQQSEPYYCGNKSQERCGKICRACCISGTTLVDVGVVAVFWITDAGVDHLQYSPAAEMTVIPLVRVAATLGTFQPLLLGKETGIATTHHHWVIVFVL